MQTRTLVPRVFVTGLLAVAGSFVLPALAQPNVGQTSLPGKEIVTPSGLKYVDLKIGQGDVADTGKVLEVHYSGKLENGVKFDSSMEDRPFTFRLGAGDAIKGWDEGLIGMKVGGRRRLVIPPELGFGKQGVGSVVPPNSVLVYDFELLAVR
ncbi:MAG TPA: FKBP-type peptidyl-prolyl cis-trans isomerase [Thermoanaerobaculia bacterium]|jgi:FKBP-type peptidyl-prolyl cis-trans isomerase|nr:FKBP-type peptidyl-prolyl cis-trans isomerase [Thermoanaerobaculia bacterium]